MKQNPILDIIKDDNSILDSKEKTALEAITKEDFRKSSESVSINLMGEGIENRLNNNEDINNQLDNSESISIFQLYLRLKYPEMGIQIDWDINSINNLIHPKNTWTEVSIPNETKELLRSKGDLNLDIKKYSDTLWEYINLDLQRPADSTLSLEEYEALIKNTVKLISEKIWCEKIQGIITQVKSERSELWLADLRWIINERISTQLWNTAKEFLVPAKFLLANTSESWIAHVEKQIKRDDNWLSDSRKASLLERYKHRMKQLKMNLTSNNPSIWLYKMIIWWDELKNYTDIQKQHSTNTTTVSDNLKTWLLSEADKEIEDKANLYTLFAVWLQCIPYLWAVPWAVVDSLDLFSSHDGITLLLKEKDLVPPWYNVDKGMFERVMAWASLAFIPLGAQGLIKSWKLAKAVSKISWIPSNDVSEFFNNFLLSFNIPANIWKVLKDFLWIDSRISKKDKIWKAIIPEIQTKIYQTDLDRSIQSVMDAENWSDKQKSLLQRHQKLQLEFKIQPPYPHLVWKSIKWEIEKIKMLKKWWPEGRVEAKRKMQEIRETTVYSRKMWVRVIKLVEDAIDQCKLKWIDASKWHEQEQMNEILEIAENKLPLEYQTILQNKLDVFYDDSIERAKLLKQDPWELFKKAFWITPSEEVNVTVWEFAVDFKVSPNDNARAYLKWEIDENNPKTIIAKSAWGFSQELPWIWKVTTQRTDWPNTTNIHETDHARHSYIDSFWGKDTQIRTGLTQEELQSLKWNNLLAWSKKALRNRFNRSLEYAKDEIFAYTKDGSNPWQIIEDLQNTSAWSHYDYTRKIRESVLDNAKANNISDSELKELVQSISAYSSKYNWIVENMVNFVQFFPDKDLLRLTPISEWWNLDKAEWIQSWPKSFSKSDFIFWTPSIKTLDNKVSGILTEINQWKDLRDIDWYITSGAIGDIFKIDLPDWPIAIKVFTNEAAFTEELTALKQLDSIDWVAHLRQSSQSEKWIAMDFVEWTTFQEFSGNFTPEQITYLIDKTIEIDKAWFSIDRNPKNFMISNEWKITFIDLDLKEWDIPIQQVVFNLLTSITEKWSFHFEYAPTRFTNWDAIDKWFDTLVSFMNVLKENHSDIFTQSSDFLVNSKPPLIHPDFLKWDWLLDNQKEQLIEWWFDL